jgi:hypothetical protein
MRICYPINKKEPADASRANRPDSKDDEIMQFSEVDKTAQKGQYLIAQGNALGMNAKINYAL